MEEITDAYARPRRDFGRPCNFVLRDAALLIDQASSTPIDIRPEPDLLASSFIVRNPVDVSVERRQVVSVHEVNTEHIQTESHGVLHVEGGWPKDVNVLEPGAKERHKRRIEKMDESFPRSLKKLVDVVETCIKENNALDIYENYFVGETADHSGEPPSARTITSFRDPAPIKRSAAALAWQGDAGAKMAVAYSNLGFQTMHDGVALSSYVWDVENPSVYDLEIAPPSPLWCLQFNPKDPHVLLGGCYNGLVAFWDTRKGSSMANSVSAVERSHRDPVYACKWVQSKSGSECFTCSTDGMVYWWDIRKLGEPIESFEIAVPKSDLPVLGGVVLDYDFTMPTKYMVGTEQGHILSCNRKARTASERVQRVFKGHHGPIYALQRNPFFAKFFLSVGDWSARIWNDDTKSAIIVTKYNNSYMTNAAWSPTRPGVFFTAKMDGHLDVWDYLHKQSDATFTHKVSDHPLRAMSVHSDGTLVAVGDEDGTISLLRLSAGLAEPQNQERQIIGAMLEREQKREKMLETRAREQKIQQKGEGGTSQLDDIAKMTPEMARQVEKDFYETVRQVEEEQRKMLSTSAVQEY